MGAANDLNILLDAVPSDWVDLLSIESDKIINLNLDYLVVEALLNVVRDRLRKKIGEAQADIDAMMLEYCPHEMTEEQKVRWSRHQTVVGSGP